MGIRMAERIFGVLGYHRSGDLARQNGSPNVDTALPTRERRRRATAQHQARPQSRREHGRRA